MADMVMMSQDDYEEIEELLERMSEWLMVWKEQVAPGARNEIILLLERTDKILNG